MADLLHVFSRLAPYVHLNWRDTDVEPTDIDDIMDVCSLILDCDSSLTVWQRIYDCKSLCCKWSQGIYSIKVGVKHTEGINGKLTDPPEFLIDTTKNV